MNPDELKVGDFLTFVDEENRVEVGRVITIERADKSCGEYAGQVHSAQMLVFPVWRSSRGNTNNPVVERYYLEDCAVRSSEVEAMAWMEAAKQYRMDLADQLCVVDKTIERKVAKSRLVPIRKLSKYDYPRLPPKPNHSWNWLWSMLRGMGIWDPQHPEKFEKEFLT